MDTLLRLQLAVIDTNLIAEVAYVLAIVLFVVGIKRLSRVRTARRANGLSALAMLIAIVATLVHAKVIDWEWIVIGLLLGTAIGMFAAWTVPMTAMPEMVALLNGSGGLASLMVALSFAWPCFVGHDGGAPLWPTAEGASRTMGAALVARDPQLAAAPEMGVAGLVLSIVIGGLTFTGSLIAYGKLNERLKLIPSNAVVFPMQHVLNLGLIVATLAVAALLGFVVEGAGLGLTLTIVLTLLALALGVLLVLPIGGADMPVVISLLNSYSGIAAAMTGFVLRENMLIVTGALVGASGIILTAIMCKAMNRSLLNVLMGGFGTTSTGAGAKDAMDYKHVRTTTAEELALMLDGVGSVIIVPGYGLAVAQAQHATRELAELLEKKGAEVRYAIHPVAGRMPGHMNVLLAESNVPYEKLVEMDEINPDFKTTDIVLVLGANDVVNPAALDEKDNPLYGMPILLVHEARNVVVVKRSLSPGYAGVKNKLFEMENTVLLKADAKQALQETLKELKEAA